MKISGKTQASIFFCIIALIPFFFIITVYYQSYELLKRAEGFNPALSTQLFDINGALISELFEENRNFIDIDKIPLHVKQAFIATEDQNFYSHTGIDIPGIFRAVLVDIVSGDIRQGGSTITQQLVKQLYTGSERSLRRKIVELLLSYKFEKRFSKNKILEMYLNQIYFGHGVYGISAAARFYFNCDVEKLSVVQAAVLAGIPSAPNRYSPLKSPKASFERTKQVLYTMRLAGYVSGGGVAEEFNAFWDGFISDIGVRYQTLSVRNITSDKAPHFTEYIRKILIEKYGRDKVYRGGLKVYTTLDLRCQKIAQEILTETITRQNQVAMQSNRYRLKYIDASLLREYLSKRKFPIGDRPHYISFLSDFADISFDELLLSAIIFSQDPIETALANFHDEFERMKQAARVEGAFVALNPADGGIVTMVGGSEFNFINQMNRAVQARRQPGSSFKPFVFATGIEYKLMTAASAFLDAPIVFRGRKKFWEPSNYDKSYYGMVLARRALAYSLNIVSVLVYELVGGNRIAQLASRLIGIPKSRFAIDPTLALGTTELTPLEMATGFAVFANGGRSVRPYSIKSIVDSGSKVIYNHDWDRKRSDQVITKQTAFIMTSLLQEVVDHGTATNAIRNIAGFTMPAAGKTGTNTKFRDAWFVGYTQDLVAAVWMGCDSQDYILGSGQSAAVVAAPLWGKFMREVYKFRKYTRFGNQPDGISRKIICSKTGKLPIGSCPTRNEFFIQGTEPTQACDGQHTEMVSIFDLVKKDKLKLIEKMKFQSEEEINSDGEKAVEKGPDERQKQTE